MISDLELSEASIPLHNEATVLKRVIRWCEEGTGVPPLMNQGGGDEAPAVQVAPYVDVDWEMHFQVLLVSGITRG